VPNDAVALTCGIDMQKSNFYFLARAWDKDLTSWLIQYGTLSTWDDVEKFVFDTRYPVQGSTEAKGIFRAALATGGGVNADDDWTRTEEAYEWLRDNIRGVIFGIKGASKDPFDTVQVKIMDRMPKSRKPIPGGLELRILHTQRLKSRPGSKQGYTFEGRVEAPQHPPWRAVLRRGFFAGGLTPANVTLKCPLLNLAEKLYAFSATTQGGRPGNRP